MEFAVERCPPANERRRTERYPYPNHNDSITTFRIGLIPKVYASKLKIVMKLGGLFAVIRETAGSSEATAFNRNMPQSQKGEDVTFRIRKQCDSRYTKKKIKRGTLGSLALAILLAFTPATAAKADYYAGGMPSTKFSVKYIGVNSIWQTLFDGARRSWNEIGSLDVHISREFPWPLDPFDRTPIMTAGRYSRNWYGLYSPSGQRSNRTFTIWVNARTLAADSGNNLLVWALSTATHELGHALSLDDNPTTSEPSLMKHDRDRNTVVRPLPYDINEVRRIYA
ncbi:MAG: hypothetical protein Q4D79_12900 [Propionibacteriaceae bacterium]|nr:hypothetical protein [Propionibacteriaceae bacterium]